MSSNERGVSNFAGTSPRRVKTDNSKIKISNNGGPLPKVKGAVNSKDFWLTNKPPTIMKKF